MALRIAWPWCLGSGAPLEKPTGSRNDHKWHSSLEEVCSDVSKSSGDACDAPKIVPPIILSKAAIILRVVSERALQRKPMSKSVLAPSLVILRAAMMLKSAPYPCLVLGARLVQKSCICTVFKDGGEIKTAFFDKIFWPWLQRHASCPLVPSGLGHSVLAGQSRKNNVQVLLWSRVRCIQQGLRIDWCHSYVVFNRWTRGGQIVVRVGALRQSGWQKCSVYACFVCSRYKGCVIARMKWRVGIVIQISSFQDMWVRSISAAHIWVRVCIWLDVSIAIKLSSCASSLCNLDISFSVVGVLRVRHVGSLKGNWRG